MNSPVAMVIIACEIGFWLLVISGLAVRYLGGGGTVTPRRRRISLVILRLVPIVDLALLVAVAADIHGGADVGNAHRLAGIYLGVTVAFGHAMINWADRKAATLAGAEAPPAPTPGLAKELRDLGRWLTAAGVAAMVTAGIALTVANGKQATDLYGTFPTLGLITVVWLVAGPIWELGKSVTRRTDDRAAPQARPCT